MKKNKKVIVIGAGMGGLSTAIRLQNEGYEVSIYEKEALPGGKMHQIKDRGYTFDVGPTLVMMPDIYRELFTLAGKNPEDYISMVKLDPMVDVIFKGEPYRQYPVSNDLVNLTKLTESFGTENSIGMLSYLSEIYKRYQVALKYFITRPFRYKRDFYNPFMLVQGLRLKTFDSADKMMGKFIPNQDLRQLLRLSNTLHWCLPKEGTFTL